MKKTTLIITLILLAFAAQTSAETSAKVKRYLFSVGANNGGQDRVLLRYAVADANAFAAMFIEMGGVEKNNALVAANPSKRELLNGFANMGKLIAGGGAAKTGARSEVFVYYSGHADEKGLKLNGETLLWTDFREAVNRLGADVRVAVLDACGSGAITRTKGGEPHPVFVVDASSNMKGYAFLTSSNEREASQESDRIKGSYFTYALLNGMRGAADMTGDGRVTINEAYLYAFNETLQNTQNTRAGTQHPSRDMNLVGTGDIVMTDLRVTSAKLSLDPNIEGQFFIWDRQGNLFAELRKTRGRAIVMGMPPGAYSVQMETPSKKWMAGDITVAEGKSAALTMNDMKAMDSRKEAVLARGGGAEKTMASRALNILDRGIYDAATYADACGDFGASFNVGSAWLYAVFDYQQPFGGYGEWPKAWGFGLGTRFGTGGKFYVNLDAVWSRVSYYNEAYTDTVRVERLPDDANRVVGEPAYAGGDGVDDETILYITPNGVKYIVKDAGGLPGVGPPDPGEIFKINHVNSSYRSVDGLAKLRFGVNCRPLPYMAVAAGVSVNMLFEEVYGRNGGHINRPFNSGPVWNDYESGGSGQKFRLWPSFNVGVILGKP